MNEASPSPRSLLRTPPAALAAFLLTVMALFSVADWSTLRHYDGIDFWQFWGVTQARRAADQEPGSPYLNATHYQDILEQRARAEDDTSLLNAIHFRKRPDLTGSPLLYAAFAAMPSDYRASLDLFRGLQVLAFVAATLLLLRSAGIEGRLVQGWLAVALLAAYDPLMFDLMVGNVNALQLLALTVAVLLCESLHRTAVGRERVTAVATAALLTLLVLLKPNVGAALLLLGLCLLLRSTNAQRRLVIVAGAGTALAVLLLTGAEYGTAGVWLDWWQKTFGSVSRLSYPLDTGNQSTSFYLASHFLLGTRTVIHALALLWLIGLGLALAWPLRGQHSLLRGAILRGVDHLRDPGCGVAIGIVSLYLLSPLSWPHYYVLGLLPACWLLRGEEPWSAPSLMAWLGLLLMAGLARRIHAITGGPADEVVFAFRVFAWLPLLVGIVAKIARAAPGRQAWGHPERFPQRHSGESRNPVFSRSVTPADGNGTKASAST